MIISWTCSEIIVRSPENPDLAHILSSTAVDGSGGTFQVRPHKSFIPGKGRERLLSLRFLSELPAMGESDTMSEISSASEPRNAYDFMRRRKEVGADPTMQTWNASVRLANFASIDNSPLCVCLLVP